MQVVNEATSGSAAALLRDARSQLRAKDERIAALLGELAVGSAAATSAEEGSAAAATSADVGVVDEREDPTQITLDDDTDDDEAARTFGRNFERFEVEMMCDIRKWCLHHSE